MNETNTICSLSNNDYAYVSIANEINSLEPEINVMEFGESLTNIAVFMLIMFLLIMFLRAKKNKLSFKNIVKHLFVIGIVPTLVIGAIFAYYKDGLAKTEHQIVAIQEKMGELDKPSTDILKLCTSQYGAFGKIGNVEIVKNKDNRPSSYKITEK